MHGLHLGALVVMGLALACDDSPAAPDGGMDTGLGMDGAADSTVDTTVETVPCGSTRCVVGRQQCCPGSSGAVYCAPEGPTCPGTDAGAPLTIPCSDFPATWPMGEQGCLFHIGTDECVISRDCLLADERGRIEVFGTRDAIQLTTSWPADIVSASRGDVTDRSPGIGATMFVTRVGPTDLVVHIRLATDAHYELTLNSDGGDLTISPITPLLSGADCPGAPFGMTCTRNGDPVWEVVDWNVFTATGITGPALEVFSEHMFYGGALGPDPSTPHGPPYDTEVSMGVAAAGYTSTNTFTLADWTPPENILFMAMIVPTSAAPRGASADFADGPTFTAEPLVLDGDVYRDGVLMDPEFDDLYSTYGSLSPAPGGTHFSHMTFGVGEDVSFVSVDTGSYTLEQRFVDADGNGWEFTIPFTVSP